MCSGVPATFCYLGSEVVCDLSCDDDECDPINQKECDGKCVDKDWCCIENGDTYCDDGNEVCIFKDSTECCPTKKACDGKCVEKNWCCIEDGDTYCDDGSEVCIFKDSTECCPTKKACDGKCVEKDWCCIEDGDMYCDDENEICISKDSTECCPEKKTCDVEKDFPYIVDGCCVCTEYHCPNGNTALCRDGSFIVTC